MTAVLIILIVLCILCVLVATVSAYFAYRATIAFWAISEQNDEYKRYLRVMLDTIIDDSEIFRTSLAKNIGMVPQAKELNSLLINLENHMKSFKYTLKSYLSESEE